MIDNREAKKLIKEKLDSREDEPLQPIELDTDEMVELMRQACAIDAANRDKTQGLQRGVTHCINALAQRREALLNGDKDPDNFDINHLDRAELEANFMQVAINVIKTS